MKTKSGLTLMELMITIAIVGILAAAATISFRHYTLLANRADALHGILNLQLAEERYRMNNNTYGTLAEIGGSGTSSQGFYTLAISNNTATSYTITATAIGSQASDTDCATITLSYANGTTSKTPATCWEED